MPFDQKIANNKHLESASLKTRAIALAVMLCAAISNAAPVSATRPPATLKVTLQQTFPNARVRLDGVIEKSDGSLFIPLIPKAVNLKAAPGLISKYPPKAPVLYSFSNGWHYLKLEDKDNKKILALPAGLKEEEKKKLTACTLPPDLIVPTGMFVSPELKPTLGELTIAVVGEAASTSNSANANSKPQLTIKTPIATNSTTGIIAVTSPQTGKITLLGSTNLDKLIELPTDGTPGGMATAGGKLYIADQTKHRVLIVDPVKKEFCGQIDFPPGSGPKDVASQLDGTFLYVSECAANKIAVVELASQKVLMRTLVPAGPTRLELTPNGYTLVVLNVPAGKVSFISTLNQKLLGVCQVGHMPSNIFITKDSRTAFVTNRMSNTISVIDIAQKKVVRTMPTGESPTGIAVSPDETKLFVANAKENTVSVFDLSNMEKIKDIILPIDVEFPGDLLLVPDNRRMLVTSAATDTLGMLNLETLEFEKQPALGCTSVDLLWIPQ
jgi:YVTN family beta-propeller protein